MNSYWIITPAFHWGFLPLTTQLIPYLMFHPVSTQVNQFHNLSYHISKYCSDMLNSPHGILFLATPSTCFLLTIHPQRPNNGRCAADELQQLAASLRRATEDFALQRHQLRQLQRRKEQQKAGPLRWGAATAGLWSLEILGI